MLSKQKFKGKAHRAKESGKSSKQSRKRNHGEEVYWSSKESDKFHRPSCEWAQEILDHNLIVYNSRQEAINDRKEPCHVCFP